MCASSAWLLIENGGAIAIGNDADKAIPSEFSGDGRLVLAHSHERKPLQKGSGKLDLGSINQEQ
jgi:hypothetical protein